LKSVREFKAGPTRILYDEAQLPAVSAEWLHPEFWHLRRSVIGQLGGRGQALALDTSAGLAVLRRYRRGGLMARLVSRRYLFTGYYRSRGFAEFLLLARLFAEGLPVPKPLAASCERRAAVYSAGLLTAMIPGAQPLAEVADDLLETDWHLLAGTLARFCTAGVRHADLNAHNILRSATGQWYLIDFDRARLGTTATDPSGMLRRLHRSFDKHGLKAPASSLSE
jgi:3-deoxy-D-manno-octulosonic acid kinase